MKILMISAECFPFAKTGGLSDAVSALAISLSQLNNEVKIILPRYYFIDKKNLSLTKSNVCVNMLWGEIPVSFWETKLFNSNVKVYFVDNEAFYGKNGIYGPSSDSSYQDNLIRFTLLNRSAFELCKNLSWFPDVLHAHDWSGSLSIEFLNNYYKKTDSRFQNVKSVLSIHNLAYQGIFPKEQQKILGLDETSLYRAGYIHNEKINLLKAAIFNAQKIITVSKSYSKEILDFQFGEGLDGLLRVKKDSLYGILNGADTNLWNPLNDKFIPFNYSCKDLSLKTKNKLYIQKKFGLEQNENIPLIGFISRLVSQKGINELFAPCYGSLYKICSQLKLQFIVIGSGEKWCEKEIQILCEKLPNLKCYIGYNEQLSHELEAACDFFLMPSVYEPCGLNQIYSMLYGTLPIVHAVGGLNDTVVNIDDISDKGTGFKFYDLTPESIFNTVKWAVDLYFEKPSLIKKTQINAMTNDFSWKKSALEYIKIFQKD